MNNTYGSFNTASGYQALYGNTLGSSNTATGNTALYSNTTGLANTATGAGALYNNTVGTENSSFGFNTLVNNSTGSFNTASGSGALQGNTQGDFNTATGGYSMYSNTGGYNNTATGFEALERQYRGLVQHRERLRRAVRQHERLPQHCRRLSDPVRQHDGHLQHRARLGRRQLPHLGRQQHLHWQRRNRDGIGNRPDRHVRDASAGLSLGSASGVIGAGVLMQIYPDGQIGSVSSSARYKDDIRDMVDASSRLMKLRPVTFRYKGQASDAARFGLIAEEVEDVLPELVVRNVDGEVEAVQYHEMPAMLLNELQKQQRVIEELQQRLAALESGQCVPEDAALSARE